MQSKRISSDLSFSLIVQEVVSESLQAYLKSKKVDKSAKFAKALSFSKSFNKNSTALVNEFKSRLEQIDETLEPANVSKIIDMITSFFPTENSDVWKSLDTNVNKNKKIKFACVVSMALLCRAMMQNTTRGKIFSLVASAIGKGKIDIDQVDEIRQFMIAALVRECAQAFIKNPPDVEKPNYKKNLFNNMIIKSVGYKLLVEAIGGEGKLKNLKGSFKQALLDLAALGIKERLEKQSKEKFEQLKSNFDENKDSISKDSFFYKLIVEIKKSEKTANAFLKEFFGLFGQKDKLNHFKNYYKEVDEFQVMKDINPDDVNLYNNRVNFKDDDGDNKNGSSVFSLFGLKSEVNQTNNQEDQGSKEDSINNEEKQKVVRSRSKSRTRVQVLGLFPSNNEEGSRELRDSRGRTSSRNQPLSENENETFAKTKSGRTIIKKNSQNSLNNKEINNNSPRK